MSYLEAFVAAGILIFWYPTCTVQCRMQDDEILKAVIGTEYSDPIHSSPKSCFPVDLLQTLARPCVQKYTRHLPFAENKGRRNPIKANLMVFCETLQTALNHQMSSIFNNQKHFQNSFPFPIHRSLLFKLIYDK